MYCGFAYEMSVCVWKQQGKITRTLDIVIADIGSQPFPLYIDFCCYNHITPARAQFANSFDKTDLSNWSIVWHMIINDQTYEWKRNNQMVGYCFKEDPVLRWCNCYL